MSLLSDRELVDAYTRGEDQAFSLLVQRYLQPVFRFLFRLVRERELAEDLAQETFVRAWKKFSSFDQERSFKTWIFAIARYAAFDAIKKKQPLRFSDLNALQEGEEGIEATIADQRPSSEALLLSQEQKNELAALLEELPLTSQEVLLLHDEEEMTFQDIALAVQEPLNTVKSRYRRALLILRKKLLEKGKKHTK